MFRSTLIAAALVIPAVAFAQVTPQQQQAKVVEKTDSVSGNLSTHDGCIDMYLYTSRNTNQDGSIHGYLSYSLYDNCNRTQLASGNGEIPAGSIVGDGKTSVKLKVNTATIRNYAMTGTALKANLSWKAVPGDYYNGKNSGNSQTGTVKSRYTGQYGWQTATVTGTSTLGDLDSVNAASISWSKNRYVTIDTRAQRSLAPAIQ